MLKSIIDLLQIDDFYEGNHDVQIAKGLYNLEKGIKGIYKQKKKNANSQKKEFRTSQKN
jgi:hypothetical protein